MYQKSQSYNVCFLRYGVRLILFFDILDHFLPFFTTLLTPKIKIWKKCKTYQEILSFYTSVPWLKIIWCLVPEKGSRRDSFFFVILNHFLPFHPPLKCQKLKFLKNEKNIEDIIILHKSTVNENHIMYDSWDMNCKRQIFLSFWHFVILSFYLTIQKMKILRNWKKKVWRYHHFKQLHQK